MIRLAWASFLTQDAIETLGAKIHAYLRPTFAIIRTMQDAAEAMPDPRMMQELYRLSLEFETAVLDLLMADIETQRPVPPGRS